MDATIGLSVIFVNPNPSDETCIVENVNDWIKQSCLAAGQVSIAYSYNTKIIHNSNVTNLTKSLNTYSKAVLQCFACPKL